MTVADNRRQVEKWLASAPSSWREQFQDGYAKLGRGPGELTLTNALRVLGITAGGNRSGDEASGRNAVPEEVRRAAMHGLKLSWENDYGAWKFIGIARGIQLATQPGVPDETMSRMSNYFSRHRKDKQAYRFGNDVDPSKGYMAWLNWGGDAGERWVTGGSAKRNPSPHHLMPLPYPYDALEPYISARTLHFHHDKHHAAYVKGLNDAEQELCRVLPSANHRWVQEIQQELAFNWGGDVLHQLYWRNLTPRYRPPSTALVQVISKSFGSWQQFRSYMKAATVKIPGSGWGVLTQTPGGLRVASVRNHQNELLWNAKPVLVIDVWEHAYYLDYQNDRGAYFDAVFDHLVDWGEVERRLACR